MSTVKSKSGLGFLGSMKDVVAIVISLISFVISTINVYVTNLKSPDLSMVIAPYIRQIVDDSSLNEAFFIPVTIVNQGAKPGAILSFELVLTYTPTGEQETYNAQYFTQEDNSELLGSFFTPLNLAGYSADGRTVCFYPRGKRDGVFFGKIGTYEFSITGVAANVQGRSQKRIFQNFKVELTQEMYDQMQLESDLEYPYPIQIELINNRQSLIEILRSIRN